MSGEFAGKTVAITGAAGGIGRWLCRFFGEQGATIAALDRNPGVNDLVDELGSDGISVKAAVADATKRIHATGKPVREDFMRFVWINDVLVAGAQHLLGTTP